MMGSVSGVGTPTHLPQEGTTVHVEGRMEEPEAFHRPVMVEEVLEILEEADEGLILDGTVGGGGHAEAMLERWPRRRVLGVDRDPEALRSAQERLDRFGPRIRLLNMGFHEAPDDAVVRQEGLAGALLDLGISSWQLDSLHRGFAFRSGVPLDMRMEGRGPSAADLLNQADEGALAGIFREYGEERRARGLARAVVRRRRDRPFRTSDDLVGAMRAALNRSPSPRDKARIFQALRIAVNREMESLERGLERIREALNAGGVLVALAYHSLEDRRVKEAFREWSRACVCPPGLPVCRCRGRALGSWLVKGPRRPSPEEVRENPRARSARLRAWRKAA